MFECILLLQLIHLIILLLQFIFNLIGVNKKDYITSKKVIVCLDFKKNTQTRSGHIKKLLCLENIGIFNALLTFENQMLCYEQDNELEILCFENKARVLLMFTYVLYWFNSIKCCFLFQKNIFHEHIESMLLVRNYSFMNSYIFIPLVT